DEDKLYILDEIKEESVRDLNLCMDSISEFITTSLYVTGPNTLIKKVKQVEAGQVVVFSRSSFNGEKSFYYKYNHDEIKDFSIQKWKDEFKSVYYEKVAKDLVESLNGKTAVIPLSGGADSRMVAYMLYKYNFKDVICFTYGDINAVQTKISKQVSESFGFDWKFIEYSKETWRELSNSNMFKEFLEYSSNYSSCPHIQDVYAVYYMKKKNLIPKDSVFIPGHSGDMIAGSHLYEEFNNNKVFTRKELLSLIIKKHYPYIKLGGLSIQDLEERILLNITNKDSYSSEEASSEFEYFDIIERQGKFICNSLRTYEFFDYEWRIPLWDSRIMDFWSTVPVNLRYERKLYFETIGKEKIKSTNDKTIKNSLASYVRSKFSVLRLILRCFYRIKEYYTHPFKWGRVTTVDKYVKYIFEAGEHFDINYIVMKIYFDRFNIKK
ncbi:asparagine synthase C-terminal domain-containing protein, partial [Clostridiaceae bacterium HSG29]|nr:asparagine synthase C-terminal domain-containing protein [Clostridiaceae bacterium HSG29]